MCLDQGRQAAAGPFFALAMLMEPTWKLTGEETAVVKAATRSRKLLGGRQSFLAPKAVIFASISQVLLTATHRMHVPLE
jgi:hypothetical protein